MCVCACVHDKQTLWQPSNCCSLQSLKYVRSCTCIYMYLHLVSKGVNHSNYLGNRNVALACACSCTCTFPCAWVGCSIEPLYAHVHVHCLLDACECCLLGHYAHVHRMSATVFVQPLDLVKNRMQLSGKLSVALFQSWCGL